MKISDDKNHSICLNCWEKVRDFDEFYVHIESVHRSASMPVLPVLPNIDDIKLETVEAELLDESDALLNQDLLTPKKKRRGVIEKNNQIVTTPTRSISLRVHKKGSHESQESIQDIAESRTASDNEINDSSCMWSNKASSDSNCEPPEPIYGAAPKTKRKQRSKFPSRFRNRQYVIDKTPHRCNGMHCQSVQLNETTMIFFIISGAKFAIYGYLMRINSIDTTSSFIWY